MGRTHPRDAKKSTVPKVMALVPGTLPWAPGGEGSGGACAEGDPLGSQSREARVPAVGRETSTSLISGSPFLTPSHAFRPDHPNFLSLGSLPDVPPLGASQPMKGELSTLPITTLQDSSLDQGQSICVSASGQVSSCPLDGPALNAQVILGQYIGDSTLRTVHWGHAVQM